MKLRESVLLQNVESALTATGFNLPEQYVPEVLEAIVESASDKLRMSKTKGKTALVFKDMKGNFLIAAIVNYHENPEEGQDNYNYYWSFDEGDIAEATVYESTEANYQSFFRQRMQQTHALDPKHEVIMIEKTLMELIDYMRVNAKEGEEFTLEDDGYFVVTSGVEDDKVVMSFLPDGPMKVLIKDDATVEA